MIDSPAFPLQRHDSKQLSAITCYGLNQESCTEPFQNLDYQNAYGTSIVKGTRVDFVKIIVWLNEKISAAQEDSRKYAPILHDQIC